MFTLIVLAALFVDAPEVATPVPTRSWTNAALAAACVDDNAAACTRLARRSLTGRGAKKDLPYAARLFEYGCELSDTPACVQLGAMLLNGNGIPVDHAAAADVFRIACGEGSASACASLGHMTARGLGGLERNKEDARALYRQACEGGWKRACRRS